MKKVLFFVLPLMLIACSLFSYQISKDYIFPIKGKAKNIASEGKTNKEMNFNRPKLIHSPLYSKTVIVINNGLDSNSFTTFSKANIPKIFENCFSGIALTEPVNDPKQSLSLLLSGSEPRFQGLKYRYNDDQLDDLSLVAQQNKKKVALVSFLTDSDEKATTKFKQVLVDWKNFDVLIFDFNNQTDLSKWKNLYLDPILQNLSNTDLFFFCSLIPETASRPFTKISQKYQSPFLISGKNINKKINPVISHENLTATLAFGMGLSTPSDCLGFPEENFFIVPDQEKVNRGHFALENFVINSVKLLYKLNINESIIAGQLFDSSDTLQSSKAKNFEDLNKQYGEMYQEIKNFTNETRQKSNLPISLIFLFLSLSALVIWLLLLIKYYRSFLFGIIFTVIFFVFYYFVFRIPLSFPNDSLLSIRWFIFNASIPLFISAMLVSVLYTMASGYVFDITYKNVLNDLNGIAGTFGLIILIETAYIINIFGFRTNIASPGYFYVSMLLRNFSIFILLSVIVLFMFGVSFVTFKLLSKYGPKPNS